MKQVRYVSAGGTAVQNGQDFLVGWGPTVVRQVWFDADSHSPGLEQATHWDWLDGVTATFVSGTAFSVTGGKGLDLWFGEVGRPVRRSSNGGTTWSYSHIDSWTFNASASSGTVYLRNAILGSPIGTVQIASDYAVSTTQYHYVGAGA